MSKHLPKAILLDLDDTILDDSGNVDRCWREACLACRTELAPIEPERVLEEVERIRDWYWNDPERHRAGRHDLDAARREIVQLALAALGIASPAVAAKIAKDYSVRREAGIELCPGAVDTIRWFRSCGCRLALLTNGSATAQRRKINRFGLAELFDVVLVEGELGFGKPDFRVYQQAFLALSVAATDTWMVGDNLEWDVAAPQALGVKGIWVDFRGAGVPHTNATRPDRIIRALSDLYVHDEQRTNKHRP